MPFALCREHCRACIFLMHNIPKGFSLSDAKELLKIWELLFASLAKQTNLGAFKSHRTRRALVVNHHRSILGQFWNWTLIILFLRLKRELDPSGWTEFVVSVPHFHLKLINLHHCTHVTLSSYKRDQFNYFVSLALNITGDSCWCYSVQPFSATDQSYYMFLADTEISGALRLMDNKWINK